MLTAQDVHALIVGCDALKATEAATRIAGASKVLHANVPRATPDVARGIDATIERVSRGYSHVLVPATANGKQISSS